MNNQIDSPILVIDNVTKSFGGLVAVHSVSFGVKRGEVVGLIGPNGAGKTTTIELISGFYTPTKGSIFFMGNRVDGLKPHQVLKRGLSRTFQQIEVLSSFTVFNTVLLPALQNTPLDKAYRRTYEILELLNLVPLANHTVSGIHPSEQRLVEIGRALSSQPKMVLLDEVMAGLTKEEAGLIVSLVKKLNEEGVTFLVVEHRLEIIRELCSRILVLNFGDKIADGPTQGVISDKRVIAAYLGGEGEKPC
jgi:branched-chain amino acid transport system ATP-binding protein